MTTRAKHKPMEIESPSIRCGDCGFTSQLDGKWSVEEGRLIWRGAADLTPFRGPNLDSCSEGAHCNLDSSRPPGVRLDRVPMARDDLASLLGAHDDVADGNF